MKKSFFLILTTLAVIVILILVIPHHVVKNGYFIRTFEYVMFTETLNMNNGKYVLESKDSLTRVEFDEKYNYLFELLKKSPVLKVEFEGKYYPISVSKHLGEIGSKLKIENILNLENAD